MSEFKVRDKVRVLAGGEGIVTYGPFNSTFDTCKMYVVKQDGDDERAFQSGDLEPLPKFSVGDKVTSTEFEYGTGESEIVAGPFVGRHSDKAFWVTVGRDGKHATPFANSLTKVTEPDLVPIDEPAEGFEYAGVLYEYGALYQDREGDLFKFRSRRSDDGTDTPEGRIDFAAPDDWNWSLAEVVRDYGPLTKQH